MICKHTQFISRNSLSWAAWHISVGHPIPQFGCCSWCTKRREKITVKSMSVGECCRPTNTSKMSIGEICEMWNL